MTKLNAELAGKEMKEEVEDWGQAEEAEEVFKKREGWAVNLTLILTLIL